MPRPRMQASKAAESRLSASLLLAEGEMNGAGKLAKKWILRPLLIEQGRQRLVKPEKDDSLLSIYL